MFPKHQAVRDNFVKKLVLKTTSTIIIESHYLSCHFCRLASNSLQDLQGLKQPNDTVITAFQRKKIGAQI